MESPTLAAEVIATTMKAMVAVILDRRPSTRDVADTMPIAVIDGEQVYGGSAAADILVDSLSTHAAGWASWLQDPAHVKPATSMVVALDAGLIDRLDLAGAADVLAALDAISGDIAGTKALSRHNAGRQQVIDLTEASTLDLTTSERQAV
jgi:hypothetical protein